MPLKAWALLIIGGVLVIVSVYLYCIGLWDWATGFAIPAVASLIYGYQLSGYTQEESYS